MASDLPAGRLRRLIGQDKYMGTYISRKEGRRIICLEKTAATSGQVSRVKRRGRVAKQRIRPREADGGAGKVIGCASVSAGICLDEFCWTGAIALRHYAKQSLSMMIAEIILVQVPKLAMIDCHHCTSSCLYL